MNQESQDPIEIANDPGIAVEEAAVTPINAQSQFQPAAPSPPGSLQEDEYPTLANSGEVDLNYRLGGLMLDGLISLPIVALHFVPGIGIVASLLSLVYWLSRDAFFGGQSIGKRIVKERVVTLDGSRFTWKHSALRNITYAPSTLLNMFAIFLVSPDLIRAAGGVNGIISLAEIITVVTTKRRIGDYLAKTRVVYGDR